MSIFDLLRKKLGDKSMMAASDDESSTSGSSTPIEPEVKVKEKLMSHEEMKQVFRSYKKERDSFDS